MVNELVLLERAARLRGYESVALSIEGAAAVLTQGDPTEVAMVHDAWVNGLHPGDLQLTHLLGCGDPAWMVQVDPYWEECAFVAGMNLRVIRTLEQWLLALDASIKAAA